MKRVPTNKYRQIFLYIPDKAYTKLKTRAKKENISMSTVVRKMIQRDLGMKDELLRMPYVEKNFKNMP